MQADGTIRDVAGNVAFTQDPDGSIRDASGKVLLFSIERFIKQICLGDHCFICGVSPKDAKFNSEHIIPRWILDLTNQFDGMLGLPNQTLFKSYGAYTTPCCVSCNSGLSDAYESVLAPLFRGGYRTLRGYLEKNGPQIIFRWLALMYLKTHLRDARLVWTRDRRKKDDTKIGDLYDWEALHHVHCIARSHYTAIDFDTRQIGSMLILPALVKPGISLFDYADLHVGRAIMIRVGEVACFAVLNDASIVQANFPRAHEVVKGGPPLTPWQLRELLVELTWRNICLTTRPKFATVPIPLPHFETYPPERVMFGAPKPEELGGEHASYGKLFHYACEQYFEAMPAEERVAAQARALAGELTFFPTDVPRWFDEQADEPATDVATKEDSPIRRHIADARANRAKNDKPSKAIKVSTRSPTKKPNRPSKAIKATRLGARKTSKRRRSKRATS